jgi:hypothetical protein
LKKLSNLVFNASALKNLTHGGADGEEGEGEWVEGQFAGEGKGEERYLYTVALLPFLFFTFCYSVFLYLLLQVPTPLPCEYDTPGNAGA